MLVDPDGRKIVVADKAQQGMVLGYLRDQFGGDLYRFNKHGVLRLNKKAFKAASGNFSSEQLNMVTGLNKVAKSKRRIDVQLYPNQEVNFSRNPLIPVETTTYDPDLQKDITRTEYLPMYEGGDGIVIPNLGQEALTVAYPGDDRAFILMDYNASATATFEAEGGGRTESCPSCLFIHEMLDHGLDYINNGSVDEPAGSTQKDNVFYHNQALKNKKYSIFFLFYKI
jgi:hypothetical protein